MACGTWFAVLRPLLPPIPLPHALRPKVTKPRVSVDLLPEEVKPGAHFTFESHDVTIVEGHESGWGAIAAVACAVLLLGSLVTALAMPTQVRHYAPRLLVKLHLRHAPVLVRQIAKAPTIRTISPAAALLPTSTTKPATTEPVDVISTTQTQVASTPPNQEKLPVQPIAEIPKPPVLTRPLTLPPVASIDEMTDREIGEAIQRGVNFLISQFDSADYEILDHHGEQTSHHTGMDALMTYALLQAGQAINDQRLAPRGQLISGILDSLKRLPITSELSDRTTYARALRATALAVYDRQTDREFLRRDAQWLIRSQRHGAYSYSTPYETSSGTSWDNSNSQYGLLGVWAAAEAGIEVPNAYWAAVEKHWNDCQVSNGGWEYVASRNSPGSLSMTCAGVASLFVCHDWMETYRMGTAVEREPFTPELRRGLEWLDTGSRVSNFINSMYWGYTLYGIERVGLASGFKYLGGRNWYPDLCKQVLEHQNDDGSFGDNVNTAYAVIFLSRGRHPILMNKLRFEGYWSNRPRDLAGLSRVASHDLERPVNWQVVSIDREWTDWTDAPILYLASHLRANLDSAALQKLRAFTYAGGMLFLQADGNSKSFDRFASQLAADLFPDYPLVDVPWDYPVYTSMYQLQTQAPPLKMVSNGARAMLIYSPEDIAKYWQTRDNHTTAGKTAFEMGMNLFVYAAGKRDLRNRLESSWLPPAVSAATFHIPVARVQYAGNWDPEPAAWTRFANWMQRQTGYGIDVSVVPMQSLDVKIHPFAHLTGTAAYGPTAAEVSAIQRYVQSGGVLFIDTCGGIGNFDQSIRAQLLGRAFPTDQVHRLSADHPMLAGKSNGVEALPRPHLRAFAIDRLGTSSGAWPSILDSGRGHVIVCPADVTSGLLATNTWGILGYEPGYAQSLMKNAILWTVDGAAQE